MKRIFLTMLFTLSALTVLFYMSHPFKAEDAWCGHWNYIESIYDPFCHVVLVKNETIPNVISATMYFQKMYSSFCTAWLIWSWLCIELEMKIWRNVEILYNSLLPFISQNTRPGLPKLVHANIGFGPDYYKNRYDCWHIYNTSEWSILFYFPPINWS